MNRINRSHGNINVIDKREVTSLRWPSEDFHQTQDKKDELLAKIKVAEVLGNMKKLKCRIYFRDFVSIKMIETTIWSVCDKNILIKSGMWIPIRRIVDVEI
jgi:hypothetical protein